MQNSDMFIFCILVIYICTPDFADDATVCTACERSGHGHGLQAFYISKRAVHEHRSKSKGCYGGEVKKINVMTCRLDDPTRSPGPRGPHWQTRNAHHRDRRVLSQTQGRRRGRTSGWAASHGPGVPGRAECKEFEPPRPHTGGPGTGSDRLHRLSGSSLTVTTMPGPAARRCCRRGREPGAESRAPRIRVSA